MRIFLRQVLPAGSAPQNPENPFQHTAVLDPRTATTAILARLWNDWRSALVIVRPETVIAWHRKGFRLYWRWKSRCCDGRPTVVLLKDFIGITPPFFQGGIHDAIRREQASFLARNLLGSCESPAVSRAALLQDREFPDGDYMWKKPPGRKESKSRLFHGLHYG